MQIKFLISVSCSFNCKQIIAVKIYVFTNKLWREKKNLTRLNNNFNQKKHYLCSQENLDGLYHQQLAAQILCSVKVYRLLLFIWKFYYITPMIMKLLLSKDNPASENTCFCCAIIYLCEHCIVLDHNDFKNISSFSLQQLTENSNI